MKSTDDNRSARVHTLAAGRSANTLSLELSAGCTSSQMAFQPGLNWKSCCATGSLASALRPRSQSKSNAAAEIWRLRFSLKKELASNAKPGVRPSGHFTVRRSVELANHRFA